MKYNIMVFFVLVPLLCKSQSQQNQNIDNKNLQFSINTTGGDISGNEFSVSYSIGQLTYLSQSEDSSAITEGVQQPLVISINPKDVEEVEDALTMAAYPNPVTNYFLIEASSYSNRSLEYQLTDLHGSLIKEGHIEEPGSQVDISELPVAVYLLIITDGNRHIKTFRIIKK